MSINGSTVSGAGIMLLNSQLKKEMPDLSMSDRSQKVAKIWSEMDQKQRDSLQFQAKLDWICDPKRKEYRSGNSPCQISTKTSSVFDTSLPFVHFRSKSRIRNLLLYPNFHANAERSNRMNINEESSTMISNLQMMRRILAQKLSDESSSIPAQRLHKYPDSDNKRRVNSTSNEIRKSRRKRLRNFARIDSDGWEGSGDADGLFNKALVAVEDEVLAIEKELYSKRPRNQHE